jgi:hypothetical protein
MQNVLQLSEFRERKRLAQFTQNMLLARVTGAQVSPATADTNRDPRNPYATSRQSDDAYSVPDSSTG